MDVRKWEDMFPDCLVEIFKWVGLETLVLSLPLVCKSWNKATVDPKCWQNLVFPDIRSSMGRHVATSNSIMLHDFPCPPFFKFVTSRSGRSATTLVLPGTCSSEVLEVIAEECPEMKYIGLSLDLLYHKGAVIENAIRNWRNLEVLSVGNCYMLKEIFTQISLHCNKFVELICCSSWIGHEEASAICCNLPRIKILRFKKAHLLQSSLIMILNGCKELEILELRDCEGVYYDDEIKRLASKIKFFVHKRSNPNEVSTKSSSS